MPRIARLDTPGLLHHIMIRGIVNKWGQPLTEGKFGKRIDRLISALVRLTHNCPESRADPNHCFLASFK